MTIIERRRIGAANADAQVHLVRKLQEIRIARGIPVADVAESMGVDVTMVYRFEKGGTNFTAATLRKYAKAVGALLQLDAVDARVAADPLGVQKVSVPDTLHDHRAANGHASFRISSQTPPTRDKNPIKPASRDFYWVSDSGMVHVSLVDDQSPSIRPESAACQ